MTHSRLQQLTGAAPLRAAALAFAALAAWGPALPRGGERLRIVLADVSASALPADLAERMASFAAGLGGRDRLAAILFGDGARPALGPTGPAEWQDIWLGRAPEPPPAADPALAGGTRIGDALRRAATLAATASREGLSPEVVVLTDGRATDTPPERERAALTLRAAGCAGLRVETLPSRDLGPRVTELRGPGAVRLGAVLSVEAQGVSGPEGGRVELLSGGRVLASRDVASGGFRVSFAIRAERAEPLRLSARIAGAPPLPGPLARVEVRAPGRALVLASGGLREGLAGTLGLDCDVRAPHDARELATEVATHDVVVVDGAVPLTESDVAALRDAVRGGAGLVLLGGPGAFRGGALDALSPLRATPPEEEGVFLYLGVDGSGSMARAWPDAARSRDDVVRGAVREVVRTADARTVLVLRRFAGDLLPAGAAPWTGVLDEAGRAAAADVVESFEDPRGGTALQPVLAEALRLAAARTERRRHALVFTDGRTAEDAVVLAAAARALRGTGCGVTVVTPGDAPAGGLHAALAGTGARIVRAGEAATLGVLFREELAAAAGAGALLAGRAARLAPGARARAPGIVAPATVARMHRLWPAADGDVLVWTETGEPLAAQRAEGLGRVAAIASRPADPAWLGRDGAPLTAALRAVVERPASRTVRIERGSDGSLLVMLPGAANSRARTAEVMLPAGDPVRAPLQAAGGGLLRALPGLAPRDAERVRILDEQGRELAAAGLDTPAPPEYLSPQPAALGGLVTLATGARAAGGRALRPLLAAIAVLLLLAAHARVGRANRANQVRQRAAR